MILRQYSGGKIFSALFVVAVALAAYFGMGLMENAHAAFNAPLDASCSTLSKYGFTSGLVFCVTETIQKAVNQYVKIMQSKFQIYEAMCLMVAVAVFGLKMMNSNMQYPIKETATFIFRVLIGVFFFNEATSIYDDLAGDNGVIAEAIGWVTGFSASGGGSGSGNNMFSNLIAANCEKANYTSPANYQGVQIWQAFDCMFGKIFGAVSPSSTGGQSTTTQVFFTSLVMVIGASLFSATLGAIVAGLGISLFVGVLLFLARALFMVLMSYLTIGFMAILSPLISPLLFFESQYLTEKFKSWLGVIVSAIFQPVFVVGFLGMTVVIDDMLIEGKLSGCKPPIFPISGSGGSDGSGVCSFTQLLNNNQSGANLMKEFIGFTEPNYTAIQQSMFGDPQGRNMDMQRFTPMDPNGDTTHGINSQLTSANNNTQQSAAQAGNLELKGTTRTKRYFPAKQLMLTLLTFMFLNNIMYGLMQVVPTMAANMTISTGGHVISQLQIPFEGTLHSFLEGADRAAMGVTSGKGLLSGNLKGPMGTADAMIAALRGGVGNVIKNN